jgi:hypothetical protein
MELRLNCRSRVCLGIVNRKEILVNRVRCVMCFVREYRLCRECQTLIEHHDQIKLLSNARNNLNTTLKVLLTANS